MGQQNKKQGIVFFILILYFSAWYSLLYQQPMMQLYR